MSIKRQKELALSFLKRKSIKHKLALIILMACITSVCLSTAVFIFSSIYQIKNEMKYDLKTIAEAVGNRNSAAFVFNDFNLVKADLSLFNTNNSVQIACLYNKKGIVFSIYNADDSLKEKCPEKQAQQYFFTKKNLIGFHDIIKNGEIIGGIYIKSDLRNINDDIIYHIYIATLILLIITFVSYFTAVILQKIIHNPIVNVMESTRYVSEGGSYSSRIKKLHDDELGTIVDIFNNILEEREQKHKEFFKKSKELSIISQKSETALEYFNKEFKTPFNAASTFRSMLKEQVFGPVNPMYLQYYNDVCSTDIELYCIVHKVMELQKIQAQIYSDNNENRNVSEIAINAIKRQFNKRQAHNIKFSSNIQDFSAKSSFQKALELFIDNIMPIFFMSEKHKEIYNMDLNVEKISRNNEDCLKVMLKFENLNNCSEYVNDNFKNLKLETLINNLKNFEKITPFDEEFIVNLDNVAIRSNINILNLLSSLNDCSVVVSISSGKIIFSLIFLCSNVIFDGNIKRLA